MEKESQVETLGKAHMGEHDMVRTNRPKRPGEWTRTAASMVQENYRVKFGAVLKPKLRKRCSQENEGANEHQKI